jgi:hypothetical protein
MGSHCSFGYLKHKFWPKERPGVRPLKVGNRPDFLVCRQRATYRWKALNEGYNFSLNLIVIEGFHKKLCALKVEGVPTVRILRFPLGSLGKKRHLDVAPVEKCKVYYKGKVVASPKSRPW